MSDQFFLDRSLGGKKVARMLRLAGWDVVTMRERYGRSTAERLEDVQWLTEMSAEGFALLTADSRIVTNETERNAIHTSHARVFIIPSGNMTGEQMAERYLRNEVAIFARARLDGPAAYAVYERRISQVFP